MTWQRNIVNFCEHYNIPVEYLADTLNEPKVVPMIRGKAFEFTVFKKLKEVFPSSRWDVQKSIMNAQLSSHDEDVAIVHLSTETRLSVECKLAGKGRFKKLSSGDFMINVKCMRSRTMGENIVRRLAPQLGISVKLLNIHNDQYRLNDFDLIVTSIGNAFYETDDDGLFYWSPNETGIDFLSRLFNTDDPDTLQKLAFNKMYLTSSKNLSVGNGFHTCSRKKCTKPKKCGFIPNYPSIIFEAKTLLPTNGWFQIEDAEKFILSVISERNR
jgi:hypothetical protein